MDGVGCVCVRFGIQFRDNNVVGTIPPVALWKDIWVCYTTRLKEFLGQLVLRAPLQPVAREVPRPARLRQQPSGTQHIFRRALESIADNEAGLFDDEDY